MRLILVFAFTLGFGLAVAYGVAAFTGLVFPAVKVPVFSVISLWWMWTGWKYAKYRYVRASAQRVLR